MIAFLHFLAYASHFEWICWAPGGHVVYGGNIVDCLTLALHQAAPHAGQVAANCTQGSF
jgi:hypothetical protein